MVTSPFAIGQPLNFSKVDSFIDTTASKTDVMNAGSSTEPTTKKQNFTSAVKRISLVGIGSGVAQLSANYTQNRKGASRRVDGSGTGDALPITPELPAERGIRSVSPAATLLKLAELMPPAAKGLLGFSDPANSNPLDCTSGLPEASLASIVTRPGLPEAPPIASAD